MRAPSRSARGVVLAALAALAGAGCPAAADRTCRAVASEPTPTAAQVCDRLRMLDCVLDLADAGSVCAAFFADWQARTTPQEFNRLVSCYVHSASCEEVDLCNASCGSMGGPVVPDGGAIPATGDGGDASVFPLEAGTDSGADTGTDAALDVSADVAVDAGTDALPDAASDVSDVSDAAFADVDVVKDASGDGP